MEADLHRFYGRGRAGTPLRVLAWFVRHLPPEAAIHGHGWSIEAMLLGDLIRALTGEAHPSDPRTVRRAAAERNALRAARERANQRRKALGITGSVLRKSGGAARA